MPADPPAPMRTEPPTSHLFCFGLGFSARRLAARRSAAGWTVSGTSRTDAAAAAHRRNGYRMHVFNGGGEGGDDGEGGGGDDAAWFKGVTHVVAGVPPGPAGDPALARFAGVLAALPTLQWLGYLSTTGVYGDTGGAWVDETAALRPNAPRSVRRVRAETAWGDLARAHGLPLHIFRLAGIYGPGRNVLARAKAGSARRIVKPGHRFSRIYVDDIAAVLEASMARPNPGAVYNVCDDEPAAPAEVTAFACGLLGVDPPPEVRFADAARSMTPMGRSFWEDSRRVRNDRIKDELGVRLAYPTYRDGLKAIYAAEFSS